MAWEKRQRGGRYYTRSRWIKGSGGKIQREYVPVSVAAICAEIDALVREERAIAAEIAREERAARDAYYAAIFAPLDALDLACAALMRRELEAAGYHQHMRGEWRRRRTRGNTSAA